MHSNTGNAIPLFECRLTFNGVELGQGRGDTKRRAREEASTKVLNKLAEATEQLDVDNVCRLTEKFHGLDGLDAIQVQLKQQQSQQLQQQKQKN